MVRIAHDVDWQATACLNVVHVGQSGIVLGPVQPDADLVIPVTFGDRPLAPGGFHLPVGSDVRAFVAAAQTARRTGGRVSLARWQAAANTVLVDLRLRSTALDPDAVRFLIRSLADYPAPVPPAPAMNSIRQRAAGWDLAHVVTSGIGDPAFAARGLIGSGPGSTPAGDDVLIGLMAGLEVARGAGLLDRAAGERTAALRAAVLDSLSRTTRISRHDLRSAVHGVFCERVHELVAALGRPTHGLTNRAATWGATSGLDLLHGVAAAARVALDPPARVPYAA
jgi:hypothetical protein